MSKPVTVHHLRLVGSAGTNRVMAGELSRLAARASLAQRLVPPRKEGTGSLVYPFDPELAGLAVHYHRTCHRVLWDLFQSSAQRLEGLYRDLRRAMEDEARPWLVSELGISVQAHGVRDFAAGERQIVGTVKNALIDGAASQGKRLWVDPDAPDLHLSARLHDGVLTVALDLAGRPMNQRGYRVAGGAAPLREDLAAVLVMLARHDSRRETLLDPMAGSGTLAIEAAGLGQARPGWIAPRRPAYVAVPALDQWIVAPKQPLFADTKPGVIANEIDDDAFALCRQHVLRAGVDDLVHCRRGDFRDLGPDAVAALCEARGMDPRRGLILSNPPYGERLAPAALGDLYRRLGVWCRRFRGWRAAFLVANRDFEGAFGGRPRIRKPLRNGPLRGYFLLYDL